MKKHKSGDTVQHKYFALDIVQIITGFEDNTKITSLFNKIEISKILKSLTLN